MAQSNYTYEDFQSYLPQAGLTEADFSAEDLALAKSNPTAGVQLLEAKADWKNATTDDQRADANNRANQVRSQYGYSGGIDGVNGNASLTPDDLPGYQPVQSSAVPQSSLPQSYMPQSSLPQSYTPPVVAQPYDMGGQTPSSFQAAPAPDPFSYEKQAPVYQSTGTYTNQYADQQQQLLGDVTNYGPFEFDAATNPQMQAYTKQYRREGDRAMQDTLGSLSAATGGMPSTAAVSAASQANDYYMSQLGDRLPEIYQSEYNKYLQDFGIVKDKLGAVNAQENIDYSKYWDGEKFNFDKFLADRNQYNTERGQALNEYQTGLGQYNEDRNFGYGQYADDLNYKTDANNTAYNRAIDADNTAYGRAYDADTTAYNRGRDTIADEQYASEQSRLADNDAFDRKYKIDALNSDAESTAYNKAVDRFEMMGYADAQTAETFGVKEGTAWGGEAADLALEQARANLEQTQANIANTNANTANVGRTGSSGSSASSGTDLNAVNAAYANVQSGSYTGADIAVLKDAGWSESEIAKLKGGGTGGGGQADLDGAMERLEAGGTNGADIALLIESGVYSESDLKDSYPAAYKAYRTYRNEQKAQDYPNV